MYRVQMLDACAAGEQRRKGEQEKGEVVAGQGIREETKDA